MTVSEQPFRVRPLLLDLPAVAATLSRRLHDAGVPVTVERAAWFAEALAVVEPISRRRLYWTARAAFVSDRMQVPAFDAVFISVFGAAPVEDPSGPVPAVPETEPAPANEQRRSSESRDSPPSGATRSDASTRGPAEATHDEPVPVLASDEEVLRAKRFDALESDELARLYRLMTRLRIATPSRRTRRAERNRHGERIDMRRTLRGSLRTAGDPIRLARRRRRVVPRRLVLLCDISGSMEPYARAYLQFLTCAAGAGIGGGRWAGPNRKRSCSPPGSLASRARCPPATPNARSSVRPPRRPTGRAAPGSATRSRRSTIATAGGAWPAARSS